MAVLAAALAEMLDRMRSQKLNPKAWLGTSAQGGTEWALDPPGRSNFRLLSI